MNKIAIAETVCSHMLMGDSKRTRSTYIRIGQVSSNGSAERQIVELLKQLMQNGVCIHSHVDRELLLRFDQKMLATASELTGMRVPGPSNR